MATGIFNFGPVLDAVLAGVKALQAGQVTIINQESKIMAALDDLNSAVAAVQTAVNTAVTLIQSLHSGSGTVSDADVENAVAQLNEAAQALGGAMPQP